MSPSLLGQLASSAGLRASFLGGCVDSLMLYRQVEQRHANRVLMRPTPPFDYAGFDHDRLTGREIAQLGYKIANSLSARGLERNARVIVARRNHADYLFFIWSSIAAGGIPISINAGTGWGFIDSIRKLTDARFIITDEDTLMRASRSELDPIFSSEVEILVAGRAFGRCAQAFGDRVVHFHPQIERASSAPPTPRELGDDTPVAMFHTSGTTGRPKCCIWNRTNVERTWKIMMTTLPVLGGTRSLVAVPFSHALYFALGTGLLLLGAETFLPARFEPADCLSCIERHRITHFMGFPYTYMRMSAEDLGAFDLRSMLLFSTGADKAHAAHIHKVIRVGAIAIPGAQRRGSFFLDSYGSTEIGAGGIVQLWAPFTTPEPCIQGRPLPGEFAFRIVGKDWRDLPRGGAGRILVKSSTHFAGYWNNHAAWSESRIDGWWWGGDVGSIDTQGRLVFLDREVDSITTSSGVVYSLPFEERLLRHPQVMEAAVFAIGRGASTEAVACVVPKNHLRRGDQGEPVRSQRRLLEQELLRFANQGSIGPTLADVRIIPLEQLPLGVTGKVLKRRLRESGGELHEMKSVQEGAL